MTSSTFRSGPASKVMYTAVMYTALVQRLCFGWDIPFMLEPYSGPRKALENPCDEV